VSTARLRRGPCSSARAVGEQTFGSLAWLVRLSSRNGPPAWRPGTARVRCFCSALRTFDSRASLAPPLAMLTDREAENTGGKATGPVVYLLHFDRSYGHARHYTGWTAGDLDRRLRGHRTGRGARLLPLRLVSHLKRSWTPHFPI